MRRLVGAPLPTREKGRATCGRPEGQTNTEYGDGPTPACTERGTNRKMTDQSDPAVLLCFFGQRVRCKDPRFVCDVYDLDHLRHLMNCQVDISEKLGLQIQDLYWYGLNYL